jgi:pimeloyl-ACP methyl ester carboxylesterase
MFYRRNYSWLLVVLAGIWSEVTKAQMQIQRDVPFSISVITPKPELKTLELSKGIKLEYAEQGQESGIPVIFLHGYSDSWYSFEQVLTLLPNSIHAYALSLRGHGNSDRPVNGYTPEDFASDVAEFMEQLKIESAVIVGHSLGATIAQRFALDYPERTKSLVLIASLASFKDNEEIKELRRIVSILEDPIDYRFVSEFQKSTLFKPLPDTLLNNFVKESMKLPASVWKSIADQSLVVDYTNELKQIEKPVLIIWGDKDLFCPKSDPETLAKTISGSLLLVYEGVGHAIHWEDPERFTNDLVDFIYKTEENSLTICKR